MSPQDLGGLESLFQEALRGVRNEEDLLRLKADFLGKKGHITLFLKGLSALPIESRPVYGARANELKGRMEEECRRLLDQLLRQKKDKRLQEEIIDVTLPGRAFERGRLHPLTQVLDEVEEIFREIGFSVFEGPEIETDFYNFEALNIPDNHPARDMQDTFYIEEGALLRTHTSPVQIHTMQRMKPPIRMIAPGAVYRRDSDISHTPMFHQVEGLVVDRGVRFSDLKGLITYFLHRLFDASLKVRFRPSYFPFTEPSAEVDIACVICRGKKKEGSSCRLCKGTGWLEVMGCGMVHPAVFEKVKIDPKKFTGLAFGVGIERIAMLKYEIPDIRLFFENDMRFLRQF